MSAQKESKDLLSELQMLKKVLGEEDAAADSLQDIPVLNDLFEAGKIETPLKAVSQPEMPTAAMASPTTVSQKADDGDSNPLLDLIRRERLVDELVEDIMPIVKNRLRLRIREMIKEESGK